MSETNAPRTSPVASSPAQEPLLRRYRQFILIVGLFAALTVAFYAFVYSQFTQAQFILVPAVISGLVLASPLILWMVRRGQSLQAGIAVLVGLSIAYAGNEVVWEGLTIFHLLGGILLVMFAGSLILPRRMWVWIGVAVFYVILLAVINILSATGQTASFFLPVRIEYQRFPLMLPFSLGSNLLLALAFIAQILIEFQARSLRTRLLVIIIVLTFVPIAAVNTISGILNANSAQQQVINELELVGDLKRTEITNWIASLQDTLRVTVLNLDEFTQLTTLLTAPSTDSAWQIYYQVVKNELSAAVTNEGLFEGFVLLTLDGNILLSTTDAEEGLNESASPYFEAALAGPVNSPVYVSPNFRRPVLVIARPVVREEQTIGILAGLASLDNLASLLSISTAMGDTGEVFLVRPPGVLVTPSRFEGYLVGAMISSDTIQTVLRGGQGEESLVGRGSYTGYRDTTVLGYYQWLPDLQVALFTEQEQREALGAAIASVQLNVLISLVFLALAIVASTIVARRIIDPLTVLARTASQISEGNLNLNVEDTLIVEQTDEIGALGRSFQTMTAQLRVLFADLEARVVERTAALESRSNQLKIAAEVARDATSIQDLDELLTRAVYLLRDRFGYYHAGIFLVDERGEYAVLAASTGEAGAKMLARSHRLRVGETGMVGYVTRTGLPRVAMDVRSDPKHYVNPDLPDTQSEAALPLRVGTNIIGAVDVQSIEKDAFSPEVISVLQIVTDQLAVAISSARLVRESQSTLRQLQVVYGEFTRQAWKTASQRMEGASGYRFAGLGLQPLAEKPSANQAGAETHTIPLRLRDQVIGEITLQFDGAGPGSELLSVYDEIGGRLALLLENARLLQDARSLAAREQQINLIANQVRSSINLDAILRNTVREIGRAFGASRTYVQLIPGSAANQTAAQTTVEEDVLS